MSEEHLVMGVITLSWKEFSNEAYEDFKAIFENCGFYMGDILEDFYGENGNGSDTYCIYIAKRKLTKQELEKEFDYMGLEI